MPCVPAIGGEMRECDECKGSPQTVGGDGKCVHYWHAYAEAAMDDLKNEVRITPAERRVVDAAMRTMRLHAKSPVLVRVRGGRPCECDLCVECRALEAERKDKPDE